MRASQASETITHRHNDRQRINYRGGGYKEGEGGRGREADAPLTAYTSATQADCVSACKPLDAPNSLRSCSADAQDDDESSSPPSPPVAATGAEAFSLPLSSPSMAGTVAEMAFHPSPAAAVGFVASPCAPQAPPSLRSSLLELSDEDDASVGSTAEPSGPARTGTTKPGLGPLPSSPAAATATLPALVEPMKPLTRGRGAEARRCEAGCSPSAPSTTLTPSWEWSR